MEGAAGAQPMVTTEAEGGASGATGKICVLFAAPSRNALISERQHHKALVPLHALTVS